MAQPVPGDSLQPAPHIALLLPLGAGPFVAHAQAVRDGFLAAAEVQGSTLLPLRIYAAREDRNTTLAGYRQALAAGAQYVVGPLTRDAVSAIASYQIIPVPTVALNVPEGSGDLPARLYMLSLQIDAEARLIARVAWQEGRRRVYTVSGVDALSRRISEAFVDEFVKLGGVHADGQIYAGDRATLDRYRAGIDAARSDAVFLALDAERGRAVRPYLGTLAVYATSQIYPGGGDPLAPFELNEVRFVGMPWLLQRDHAAVMVYPRRDYGADLDLQRLYALGIDAFRVVHDIAAGRSRFTLDGVTGTLTLAADQRFQRALPIAQFIDGTVVIVGEARP